MWRCSLLRNLCFVVGVSLAPMCASFNGFLYPVAVAATRAPTVGEAFKRGVAAYRRGNLRKAAKILAAIVRRYPSHQPSLLLLARIYYGTGNIKGAVAIFKRLPIGVLPPYMLYDYGVSMFAVGDCKRSVDALSQVPSKSRVRFLASFYLGVCHFRARDFQRAEFFLRRAEKLPSNLAGSRRKLLAEIDASQSSRQSGNVAPAVAFVYVPPPPPVLPAYLPASPQAPQQTLEVKEPQGGITAKPASGFSASFKPSMTFTRYGSEIQFHQNRVDSGFATLNLVKIVAATQLRYDFAPFDSGGQPNLAMALTVDDRSTTAQVTTERLRGISLVLNNEEGDEESIPYVNATATTLKAKPSVTVPVTSFLEVVGEFERTATLPQRKFGEGGGSQKLKGSASVEVDLATLKASYESVDSLDKNGAAIKTDGKFAGGVDLNFERWVLKGSFSTKDSVAPAGFDAPSPANVQEIAASATRKGETYQVTARVKQTTNTPPAGRRIEVPNGAEKLVYGVVGSLTLPFKTTLYGGYLLESITGAQCVFAEGKSCGKAGAEDQKTVANMTIEGTSQFVGIEFNPFSFVFVAISRTDNTSVFGGIPKPISKAFKDGTIDYDAITQFSLGVNWTF